MDRLEQLLNDLPNNPNLIKDIETQVQMIANEEGIQTLASMIGSSNPQIRFYALLIAEQKIKATKRTGSIAPELINLLNECANISFYFADSLTSNRFATTYAIAGLYDWPDEFPAFFDNVIGLISVMNRPIAPNPGLNILEKFLFMVNRSPEITEKRRTDLKRCIKNKSINFLPLIDAYQPIKDVDIDKNFVLITLIYSHLMSILPKNDINYKIIFSQHGNKAGILEFTGEAIFYGLAKKEFIEYLIENTCRDLIRDSKLGIKQINNFTNLLHKIEKEKPTNIDYLYQFMFYALKSEENVFISCTNFWIHFFKIQGEKDGSAEIASAVLTEFNNNVNRLIASEMISESKEVFDLYNLLGTKYSNLIPQFLANSVVPRKFAVSLIKNYARKEDLKLEDPFLLCTKLFLDDKQNCINLINQLDLKDKESCKLISKILVKYNYEDKAGLFKKIYLYQNNECVNEILIILAVQLRIDPANILEGEWNEMKLKRFYYFIKYSPMLETLNGMLNSFYNYFLETQNYSHCFSILSLVSIPENILSRIYQIIDIIDLRDLSCFNHDILKKLNDNILPAFLQQVFNRLKREWSDVEDINLLVTCTNGFIRVLEIRLSKFHNINVLNESVPFPGLIESYSEILIELLQTGDASIIKRISNYLIRSDISFNMQKAVYYLLMCYNSSLLVDIQNDIVTFLLECLKKENGEKAFIAVKSEEECIQLKNDFISSGPKKQRELLKLFLREVKGKPLNQLYSSDWKIGN
ncbi:hypothetical protein TCON_1160 [Astathelohania contejeani]|uniref:F-box domain-containing protein n=1 Tax=Astathelohania contejeani TaxID=164912 RepID=A0ABQ7HZW0_9MICR|nr:hypothetical protein TCON_1160 [Thelohania contejeani]